MAGSDIDKVVLAYSGGLDTSVIVPWLREKYHCEVVCFTADIGQGEELAGLEEKALASGASKLIQADLRDEFARDYLFPMLQSGAVYEHKYLLGTAIARPLIAKWQVTTAEQEGAEAVAHGCTGKGNDQVRFELTFKALGPTLKVIAPWREWDIHSREDALEYAAKHDIAVSATTRSIYSRDRNLWHLSHEGGPLEDPAEEPEEALFQWTASPESAPDKPEMVQVGFEQGLPTSVNGEQLGPAELIERLNDIGARHGVGRVDFAGVGTWRQGPQSFAALPGIEPRGGKRPGRLVGFVVFGVRVGLRHHRAMRAVFRSGRTLRDLPHLLLARLLVGPAQLDGLVHRQRFIEFGHPRR